MSPSEITVTNHLDALPQNHPLCSLFQQAQKKRYQDITQRVREYEEQSQSFVKTANVISGLTPVTVYICTWSEPRGGEYDSWQETISEAFSDENEALNLMRNNSKGVYRSSNLVYASTYFSDAQMNFFSVSATDDGFKLKKERIKLSAKQQVLVDQNSKIEELIAQRDLLDRQINGMGNK